VRLISATIHNPNKRSSTGVCEDINDTRRLKKKTSVLQKKIKQNKYEEGNGALKYRRRHKEERQREKKIVGIHRAPFTFFAYIYLF
jgi:hypothetical protein